MTAARVIRIAAAVILDRTGRMLIVRKSGTTAFMQPGGKLELGEDPAQCLVRELHEELALVVTVDELDHVGWFAADAANEAGWRVECDVYRVPLDSLSSLSSLSDPPEVQAEIAEARWASRAELLALAADGVLAPLTRDNLERFLPA